VPVVGVGCVPPELTPFLWSTCSSVNGPQSTLLVVPRCRRLHALRVRLARFREWRRVVEPRFLPV